MHRVARYWGQINRQPVSLIELLGQIFNDYSMFCPDQLLNVRNRQSGFHAAGCHLDGLRPGFICCYWLVFAGDGFDLFLQIVCFEVINICSVPLCTFFQVPLPFAFCSATGLLPVFKPRVG